MPEFIPALIGVGLSLAGQSIQNNRASSAAKKQAAIIEQSINDSQMFDQKRSDLIPKNLEQFNTTNQQQVLKDETGKNTDSLVSFLTQGNNSLNPSTGETGGKVSDVFDFQSMKSKAKTFADAVDRAKLFGADQAQSGLGFNNAVVDSRFALDTTNIGRAQRQKAREAARSARLAGKVQPSFAGQALQGGGNALATAGLLSLFPK